METREFTVLDVLQGRGQTQAYLRRQLWAKGYPVSPATVHLWCSRRRMPKPIVVRLICEILGVEEADIVKTTQDGAVKI